MYRALLLSVAPDVPLPAPAFIACIGRPMDVSDAQVHNSMCFIIIDLLMRQILQ
jgi:hypothetical protein